MSISGNLADVTVADVMQFVHLGGRTGTLVIKSEAGDAEIGFHRGRIISAWTPESQRLGDLLTRKGVIGEDTLMEALARQDREVPKVSLGKVLVSMEAVTKDQLREVVAEQIEHTIYELVTRSEGEFDFALDELRPVDDIAVYPGDILPDINLNTQIVVLEALRIFDEKNRGTTETAGEDEAGGESGEAPPAETVSQLAAEAPLEAADEVDFESLVTGSRQGATEGDAGKSPGATSREREGVSKPRFQVVSADAALLEELREIVPAAAIELAEVKLWDSGLTLPGETPPIVLLDLREGDIEFADLESFCRSRAHASILAIPASPASTSRLYEAGALAAVPADAEAIHSCLRSVVRSRRGRARIVSEQLETNAGFAKLRRVVADLRSGLLSATVALNLMQVISESVERAIMFVVRGDKLVALGAFGSAPDGSLLAQATHRFEIPLSARSVLSEAIDDGRARSLRFEDADLPPEFEERVGCPRTGQIVVFPVVGSRQVNSVVYTDNGRLSREIEEIEILELAAAQVGVAFENEFLRRQMQQHDAEAKASSGKADLHQVL